MKAGAPVLATLIALVPLGEAEAADTAKQLGELIGSEKACALKFDENAVRAYIEKNVSADDLVFAGRLITSDTRVTADKMSSTELAAHCFQIKRSADALGLLAK